MSTIVVDELLTLLGFKVDKTQLGSAEQALSGVEGKIKDVVMQAGGMIAMFFGIEKAAEGLMESIKLSGEMESMTMQFKTMLGDLDSAKYLVQEIQKYSLVTPYTTLQLSDQVRLMMAFGQSANEAMHSIQLVGDVAGADTERMHRLSYALGQVTSATYLKGDDLRQFVEAGFNPLTELAKESGKSMSQLRKDMEAGKISAAQVTHAFELATGPGGKFFEHMKEQSLTLVGLWSTLKDRFQMLMISIGDAAMPYIKAVITALIPMVDSIQMAANQLSLFFQLFLQNGPSAEETATGIATAFMTIADVIMTVVSAFQFFLTGITVVQVAIAEVVGFVVDLIMAIPKAIASTIHGLLDLANLAASLVPGGKSHQYAGTQARLERFMGTGYSEYTSRAAGSGSEAIGADWEKFRKMSDMIGGSAENPNPQVKFTDKILANLSGGTKVVNNNIHNEVTVNAEGGFKDLLKEGANSVFSLTFGEKFATRLVAATV